MNPKQATQLMTEALAEQQDGNAARAYELYKKIIQSFPAHPETLHNAGLAAFSLEKFQEAELLLLRAVQTQPSLTSAKCNLIRLWIKLDSVDDLVKAARNPSWFPNTDPALIDQLGTCLLSHDLFDDACSVFSQGVLTNPSTTTLIFGLGQCHLALHRFDKAEQCFRECLLIDKQSARSYVGLARSLLGKHLKLKSHSLHEDASRYLQEAIEIDPSMVSAYFYLGTMSEEAGDFAAASAYFEHALKLEPTYLPALSSLTAMKEYPSSGETFRQLEKLMLSPETSRSQRVAGFQAMGRWLERCGEYSDAFRHYQKSNNAAGDPNSYDRNALEQYVDELCKTYSPVRLSLDARPNSSQRPLFVVGMPRSGTTLLEQILASHPEIGGGGEFPYFLSLEKQGTGLHDCSGSPTQVWNDPASLASCVASIAEQYLQHLKQADAESNHVVDKMPFNFFHIGAIRSVFPRATIVYCTRDWMDVGLSCFVESFGREHTFARSLSGIGHYLLMHKRIMHHWHAQFADGIAQVRYEDLITNVRSEVEPVLQKLGLSWHPNCDQFFRTPRTVRTPSKWQVRQPLYASSINRWRFFQEELKPLSCALQE